MILTFSLYAALAILPPAVWVCARIRYTNMRRETAVHSTAQVIHFPRDYRRSKHRKGAR